MKHPFAFKIRPIWRVRDRDVRFPRVTGVARRALAFDFEEARGWGVVERGNPGSIDDRRDPRFRTGLVVGEIIAEIEPELIGREILGNRKGQCLFDGPDRLEDGKSIGTLCRGFLAIRKGRKDGQGDVRIRG